ncbi:helicase C-terminal domain-containing protein [Flagelloscypha sp. PMI_526]|nr:helicase C-terminal domain-containing protein [Flagelloscypha sp. PMI_526]
MSAQITLPTPSSFPAFPYSPPYEIQVELMRHLYETIEESKVTIVESPTGTGKTLTLLCSSLTWLRDDKDRIRRGVLQQIKDSQAAEPPWVVEHVLNKKRAELESQDELYRLKLQEAHKREQIARKMAAGRVKKKPKLTKDDNGQHSTLDDRAFLPEDDDVAAVEVDGLTPEARAILAKIERSSRAGEDDIEPTCTKIYYASRTHSQLSQVLPELERLGLENSPLDITNLHNDSSACSQGKKRPAPDDASGTCKNSTRTVSLGSRKQLCINDELRKRSKDIDESCRELLGEKGSKRCQFLPPIEEEDAILDFRDEILAVPKDIEDLAQAGRASGVCPYFGSRRAIPQAELITLPYNLLLQKTAREALGIDLTDQIVIIDEAHNLISTLLSLSTATLPSLVLSRSLMQISTYLSKFQTRLSPKNLMHIKALVLFLEGLKEYLTQWKEETIKRAQKEGAAAVRSEVMTLVQLTEKLGARVATINLLEIETYLRKSKIARKIAGYDDKLAEKQANKEGTSYVSKKGSVPPLHAVENFLVAVSGSTEDGRLTLTLTGKAGHEEVEIKYQHLNPAPHFAEVIDSARSVILAGGTMSPVSDVVNQLFPHLPSEKLSTFSCGHIIPESNLKPLVVSKSPRGNTLEYKAGKQSDPAVLADLGMIVSNLANIVPAGMVVFFPSYSFLNLAKKEWSESLLDKLGKRKKVFFEPESSADVERILTDYSSAAIPSGGKGGALLFAVIGAKLSEGLNFKDDLARSVVIIGMPYANMRSPELRERLSYVARTQEKSGKAPGERDAAQELYENMCMNAVNQSIGRAIRHRADWASLVLVDQRYGKAHVKAKLPKWIGGSLVVTQTFGEVMKELGTFYRSKKSVG